MVTVYRIILTTCWVTEQIVIDTTKSKIIPLDYTLSTNFIQILLLEKKAMLTSAKYHMHKGMHTCVDQHTHTHTHTLLCLNYTQIHTNNV